MQFRSFRRLFGFAAIGSMAVALSVTTAEAEQIRLSDGRIVQGEVVGAVTETGFNFRLTSTGGQAFFRWTQINKEDEARLRNIKDPDAGLQLIVYVQGDRLNRLNGDPIEGRVEVMSDHFLVKNQRFKTGVKVPVEEVVEGPDALQKNVQIDARVIHTPAEVLALREAELPAEATAQDYYALARLAEHMGLFVEAQDRLQRCLDLAPTSKLLTAAETMKARVDELIKQSAVLKLLDAVRGLAENRNFAHALYELGEAMKGERNGTKPTGAILDAMERLKLEIEAEYMGWVINEWNDEAYQAIRTWVKANKDATVNEAVNFARRTSEQELLKSMVAQSRGALDKKLVSDALITGQIRNNMAARLTDKWTKKLRERNADFGKDGWYQIVQGNLPNAGKQRAQQPQQPPQGNQPPRFPRQPGGGGGGGGPRGGSDFAPESFEFPGVSGAPADFAPQEGPKGGEKKEEEKKEGDGGIGDVDADAIAEIAKRIAEAAEAAKKRGQENSGQVEGGPRRPSAQYKEDDPRWKDVPAVVPSLQDWWIKQSDTRKMKWMMAVYARDGMTMDIVRESYHRFTYR